MWRELTKIVLTACFTLGGGVVLLVVSQIFTRFVVDPLIDFRRLLGEVSYTLILNAQFLFNASATASNPKFQQATEQCRVLASRLHAFSAAVPLYRLLSHIRLVPCLGYVYDAAKMLIGLSNTNATTPPGVVQQMYDSISKLLGIRVD
jgi:hypothetical protein